eukprot:gene2939-3207_t
MLSPLSMYSVEEILFYLEESSSITAPSPSSSSSSSSSPASSSSSDEVVCIGEKRSRSDEDVDDHNYAVVLKKKSTVLQDEVDLRPRPTPDRAWRRKSPFPHIPKRDFRRDFPVMLANISNCGDFDVYARFFRTILFADCCMVDYKTSSSGIMQPIYQVCGVKDIIDFFVQRMDSSPDATFEVKDAQIKQFLHKGGSEIIINAHICGTRIREVLVEVKDEKNRVHTVPCAAYLALLEGRGVISSMPLSEALSVISSPQCWADFKLDIKPDVIDIRTSITYFLDNSNRIYKIEKRFH